MSDKCYFDKSKHYCSALTLKDCNGCSFRKTEKEYFDGLVNAERILEEKGLKPFEHIAEKGFNMGVQPK
jgi:hypothetical protein